MAEPSHGMVYFSFSNQPIFGTAITKYILSGLFSFFFVRTKKIWRFISRAGFAMCWQVAPITAMQDRANAAK
jgi:hypothetical protein